MSLLFLLPKKVDSLLSLLKRRETMKHLFIVNHYSQSGSNKEEFLNTIKETFEGLDYEIYQTTGPREVIPFLKQYLLDHKKETIRVYACGGDGTVHEVVNGIVGFNNAELAIVPIGTGNDFVKYYGGPSRFLDLKKQIEAETTQIDLSRISGESLKEPWYSINVINFGFDAIVGAVGNKYKDMGKKDPYGKALKVAMLKGRFNNTTVSADGERLNKKKFLLCSLAQGNYVGGKFKAAPKSVNDDGLIDVCLLKCMCFLHLGLIMGPYTAGKHLDKPNRKIVYRRAKHITIDAPKEIDICVDGEMIRGKHFEVEVVPHAIKLVLPKE